MRPYDRLIPDYPSEPIPDISRPETREKLSKPAIDGFFAIMEVWGVPTEQAGHLLGGVPRSSMFKLKNSQTILRFDELTRVSYVLGIYQALHALLPEKHANEWFTRQNDVPFLRGETPIEYAIRGGIPALEQIRKMLDAAR
jgi:hypothetical protein